MNDKNFIIKNYDRIAVGVAALLLVGTLAMLMMADGSAAEKKEAYQRQLDSLEPTSQEKELANMSEFDSARRLALKPPVMLAISVKEASFLASERRIWCADEKCHKAIPFAAKECPFCKKVQPEDVIVTVDTDGDGLSNDFEQKMGLNPNDPADAALDKDGDTFTNLEEFLAKTDLNDPKSHPEYSDYFGVKEITGKKLPFYLVDVVTMPDGKPQFTFKTLGQYPRSAFIREGAAIIADGFPTNFVMKAYTKKIEEREMPGGWKKKFDVSVTTILRTTDKKEISMRIGERGIETDTEAIIVYTRDNSTRTVSEGSTFTIGESAYLVTSVNRASGEVTVTNKSLSGAKNKKVIHKLD